MITFCLAQPRLLKRSFTTLFLLQLAVLAQGQLYRIPVVIHVLHQNGMENISDAQIMDGMSMLNTIFNAGFGEPIAPPFDAISAQMDVEFCLATIAPDGSTTTGIERIETPLTDAGGTAQSYVGQWPPERYLNIWLIRAGVENIYTQGSYLPEDAEVTPEKDGVMLLHSYFGSIGTSSPVRGKSIGLMVGRYFGLKLLWETPTGVGDCGDDEVADTPETGIIMTCNTNDPSCVNGVNSNVQNYMTYSLCQAMFTQGQRTRVHNYLNSGTAQRNNLCSATNLGLTGCGPTSLNEPSVQHAFEVHPNPFTERITVSGPTSIHGVQLLDPTGRIVPTQAVRLHSSTLLVTGTDLASGTYFLRVEHSTGVVTRVLVK